MQVPGMKEVADTLDTALDRPAVTLLEQMKGMMRHPDDNMGIEVAQ
jgi:hypothetical protein